MLILETCLPTRTFNIFKKIYHFKVKKTLCFISHTSLRSCSHNPLKKDLVTPYPLAYDPTEVERGWYEWWERNRLFSSESELYNIKKGAPKFTLVMPPPNVTGNLHIGHTLTVTIQDCIVRWLRMKGQEVSWIPGFDHGGIATQTVVERKLLKEKGLTRHDMGREQFIDEVNQWKCRTQSNIESQLKKLGASLDFEKCLFTMDENSSKAVTKVFIQLFEENLIYRKEKLVNWSSEIKSVISDIEVDHLEIPGNSKIRVPGIKDPVQLGLMDYFYYPVLDSEEKLLIATTRLETMLGDTAVAINPNDTRYSHLIGSYVVHPYTGEHLPIIAEESINKEFGSGVMKVTPAHDSKDFEIALKHNLKATDAFNDDGTISLDIENFKGKHRLIVRQLLRTSLSNKGLYKEAKSHDMAIPFCSRTGDIVEPRLKEQWYLNCTQMGEKAVEVVREKKLNFIPEHHSKVWNEFFKHLQDWCISRQLWWGHKIPAYKVYSKAQPEAKFYWVAATNKEEAIKKASEKYSMDVASLDAIQDNDVLDTWFSSALYPLTALGWPSEKSEFQNQYPLSLMETGFDILFFWVARMVMLGEHITGKLPFDKVLLHGMVCDSQGRKMTKSLGNTIDPLDVITGVSLEELLERVNNNKDLSPEEIKSMTSGYKKHFPTGIPECGTDGLRFALMLHDVQNQRISIDVKSIRICRHFCNKIWQGFRLFTKASENCSKGHLTPLSTEEVLSLSENDIDRWILSRLAGLVTVANTNFEIYSFHPVAAAIRQFWVQNFCDIYLEHVKSEMRMSEERRIFLCRVMLTCIETFLRVISPMMPYLSEELYQRLISMANIKCHFSVSTAPYPSAEQYPGWRNTLLEANVHTVMDLIEASRSLKVQHGATKSTPTVVIAVEEESTLNALNPFSKLITTLAKLESVTFHLTQGENRIEQPSQDTWVCQSCDHGITVIMDIGEKIDLRGTHMTKLEKIRKELDKLNKMLSDRGYRKKAPLSVQEKTMAKKAALEAELQKLSNYYIKSESEVKTKSSCS